MRYVSLLAGLLTVSLINLRCTVQNISVSPYPEVTIISPTPSSQILDTTTIVIDASDDKGIAHVQLYIDGRIPKGGDMLYVPYTYAWDTSQLPDTSKHQIFAKAYDTDSNVTVTPTLTVTIYRFQPTNLSAQLVSDTLVSLSWKDNCSKETGYQVVSQESNGTYDLVANLPPNTTSLDISGLYLTSQTYTYLVRAVIDTLKSKFSNPAIITPVVTAPAQLTASMLSDTSISLAWQIRLHSIVQFVNVEEAVDTASFTVVRTLPVATDTLILPGRYLLGSSYQFRVMGYTSHGNKSSYSNVAAASVYFPGPNALRGTTASTSSIRLTWIDNSTIEKQFSVERKTATSDFNEVGRVGANVTTYTDVGLDSAQAYTYRVRALSTNNASAYSPSATFNYVLAFFESQSIQADNRAIAGVSFVGATNSVISSAQNNSAAVWDATTGIQTGIFSGSPAPITALEANPTGTTLVTGTSDGNVQIWNIPSRSLLRTIKAFATGLSSVSVSGDGSLVAGACGSTPFLGVWRASDGTLVWSDTAHAAKINAIVFSPDGSMLLSCSDDHSIKAWRSADGSLLWTAQKSTDFFRALAVTNARDLVVSAGVSQLDPLSIWQLSSGTPLGGFIGSSAGGGTPGNAVSISSGGDSLVCGYGDNELRVWEVTTRSLLDEAAGHTSSVVAVQFNQTGDLIASGDAGGILKVWKRTKSWR
ncbi:MAG TPA: Ig-like domain-containing protein [Bacteroidota bacterium]|nr:Ig-like domain-containing protein [Bacteroidota bacterium]